MSACLVRRVVCGGEVGVENPCRGLLGVLGGNGGVGVCIDMVGEVSRFGEGS